MIHRNQKEKDGQERPCPALSWGHRDTRSSARPFPQRLLLGEGLPALTFQERSKAQPAGVPNSRGSPMWSSGSAEPLESVGRPLPSSPSHLLHMKVLSVPSEPRRGGTPQGQGPLNAQQRAGGDSSKALAKTRTHAPPAPEMRSLHSRFPFSTAKKPRCIYPPLSQRRRGVF